ncbi:MAG TPA: rhodanese-like domain-containing protein [Rhodocyclaceae bacterium]|nr:rhodanese-like domain-containing protein [Rhodocyclaceae bacterium]
MKQISPTDLAAWLADATRLQPALLDVREAWEYGICHIQGSQHMPMGSVPARLSELDPQAELVVICHHGARSAQVGMFLERQGFDKVHNLAGGVAGWAAQVDPAMPQY